VMFPEPIETIAVIVKLKNGKVHEVITNEKIKKAVLEFLFKQSSSGKLVISENDLSNTINLET